MSQCTGHPQCQFQTLWEDWPHFERSPNAKMIRCTKSQEIFLVSRCYLQDQKKWIVCNEHLSKMTQKPLKHIEDLKIRMVNKMDKLLSEIDRIRSTVPPPPTVVAQNISSSSYLSSSPSLFRDENLQKGVTSSMEELLGILGLVHSLSPYHLSQLAEAQREIKWSSVTPEHVAAVVPLLSPLFYIDLYDFLKSLPLRLSGLVLSYPTVSLTKHSSLPKAIVCALVGLEKLIFETSSEDKAPEILNDPDFTKQLFDLLLLLLCTELELLYGHSPPKNKVKQVFTPSLLSPVGSYWWECTGATIWLLNRLLSFDLSGQSLMVASHSFLSSFLSHPKLYLFVEGVLDLLCISTHEVLRLEGLSKGEFIGDGVKDCVLYGLDALFWMFLSTDLAVVVFGNSSKPFSSSMSRGEFLKGIVIFSRMLIGWSMKEGKIISSRKKFIYHVVRLLVVLVEKDDPYFLDIVSEQCKGMTKDLLSLICGVAEQLVQHHLGDIVLTECLRLLELCCDDSNFKEFLASKIVNPILIFLSAPPNPLARTLTIACPERINIYLFVVLISNLHCHNDHLCGPEYRNFFCNLAGKRCTTAYEAMSKEGSSLHELKIFPVFISKNLETIRKHLGEGRGRVWENPYMSIEDVSLFVDFVTSFLRKFEGVWGGGDSLSYSHALLLSLPSSQREHSQLLLPEGQGTLEALSLVSNTIASVQYSKIDRKRKKKGHANNEYLTGMVFALKSTLQRSQPLSEAPPLPPLSLSEDFPLNGVYQRMLFFVRHRTIIGPPTMGHSTIITPQVDSHQLEPQKKKRRIME